MAVVSDSELYRGMSYEQASREAARLIERDGWFKNFDALAALRSVMLRDMARDPQRWASKWMSGAVHTFNVGAKGGIIPDA